MNPTPPSPADPQTLRLPGLEAPVLVCRDTWGIPHVRARSSHDAYFAQGFVHAEDRLWQMDAARRRMQGRWAEWVGPSGVAADTLARRLGVVASCQRDLAALLPPTREMLQAYADGVNAWLALGRPLPPEYTHAGTTPEPWLPWHSIAAMRQRGYLMGSLWFKLWRAVALQHVPPGEVVKLRYDDGGADRLCVPPGADGQRWVAGLQDLAPSMAALAEMSGGDATGGGSNNWAVAPGRTASGRPLLAGDPHRVFELPGMYAQGHLACDTFDAIGLAVPGVPGFPHFGHNGRVAWCVTHAFADIHDLFVERFKSNGDALSCAFRDEWRPVQQRREQIQVRGGSLVDIDIVETGHGPVIAGDVARGHGLVLRSMQFIPIDRSFDCLHPMLSAPDVPALYESTRGWGLIDHHLVAADTSGHIGHRVRALVPRRPRRNGWLPVPGWSGEHEWDGVVPFEQMPNSLDPARGYLVTANNRFVADDRPGNDTYFLTDCHPPYRAQRVEAMLDALPQATVDDMARMHRDVTSLSAPVFQRVLAGLAVPDPAQAALRDAIVGWDGQLQAASSGAAAYSAFRWQLAAVLAERSGLARAAGHPWMKLPPGVSPVLQLWWTLPQLVRTDDTGLLMGSTWPQAFADALQRTAAGFPGGLWGAHHRARLMHPLAGLSDAAAQALGLAGLPVSGDNDCVMANGCVPALGLDAGYGAVARYVFDVGNWDASRWIVLDGVSGIAGHPHHGDQHAAWARGDLVPMLYSWDAVSHAAQGRQYVLTP
ncbi:MAG: penicillin acylase family protein [Aquabacterium sp.]